MTAVRSYIPVEHRSAGHNSEAAAGAVHTPAEAEPDRNPAEAADHNSETAVHIPEAAADAVHTLAETEAVRSPAEDADHNSAPVHSPEPAAHIPAAGPKLHVQTC